MSDRNQESLDRLLHGLGSAEPGAGFEQRVLAGVAARVAVRQPHRPVRLAWGCGLAAAIVAALGVAAPLHRPAPHAVPVATARTPQVLPAEPTFAESHAARGFARPALRHAAHTAHRNQDSQALVSFPAPPEPLTEQEKLLLQIAHRRDPQEMAMLNPAVQAQQQAAEAAEYEEFFNPPPLPPEDDAATPIKEDKGETR